MGEAVKDGVIEIQGDKRDLFKQLLVAKGMQVILVGGVVQNFFRALALFTVASILILFIFNVSQVMPLIG